MWKCIRFSSVTQLCPILCDPMNRSMAGLPVHHQLPKFTQTHVHWVGDAIQLSHPLLSPLLPVFNLSQHRVFSSELALPIRWPKYGSFSFSISPSNEYSGLISLRIDLFNHLAVQGTLKSLLQHHDLKASVLQCSAFFRALHYPFSKIFILQLSIHNCIQSVAISMQFSFFLYWRLIMKQRLSKRKTNWENLYIHEKKHKKENDSWWSTKL